MPGVEDVFGWVGHQLGGASLHPTLPSTERRRFLSLFLGEARALDHQHNDIALR
jgi:hypothetical protein